MSETCAYLYERSNRLCGLRRESEIHHYHHFVPPAAAEPCPVCAAYADKFGPCGACAGTGQHDTDQLSKKGLATR